MENDKIHDYTDACLESYLRALDKTHNSDLAIQTATGVFKNDRCEERTEAASAAADQSNGGALWSYMQQAAKNQQEEGNPEGSEIESDDDE